MHYKHSLRTEVDSDFMRFIIDRKINTNHIRFHSYRKENFMQIVERFTIFQALGTYRPSRDESFSIHLSRLLMHNLKKYIKIDLEHLREQLDGHLNAHFEMPSCILITPRLWIKFSATSASIFLNFLQAQLSFRRWDRCGKDLHPTPLQPRYQFR